jgi:hypothetical protein
MTVPSSRAWQRPQQARLEKVVAKMTFGESLRAHAESMRKKLEDQEEFAKVVAYLSGTIVGRNEAQITPEFCTSVLKDNSSIAKHFYIDIPADKSAKIPESDLGIVGAFLIELIKRRDARMQEAK